MKDAEMNNSTDHLMDNLIDYLFAKDEASLILKIHLHIEQYLDILIVKVFPKPSHLLSKTFSDKIQILNTISLLDKEMFERLSHLNKIRNKFSHQYRYQLSKEDIAFFKKMQGGEPFEIPPSLKHYPGIDKLIMLVRATGYISGRLSYLSDVVKKINMSHIISIKKVVDTK